MKPDDDDKRLKRRKSLRERWEGFCSRLIGDYYHVTRNFDQLSTAEQDRYVERFSITICVGFACVLSSFFYWFLPPLFRILVVPILIGAAWWAGAKLPKALNRFYLGSPSERETFIQQLHVVEFFQLIEAVKFSVLSFCFALIPFAMNRELLEHCMESPEIRTLFLCMLIWNLVGAPLFAQAKNGKARLIISLVFGVPAATVTVWGPLLM